MNEYKPIRSSARLPKYSPRMVILVPGGPSFGDKPVTTGFGAIDCVQSFPDQQVIFLNLMKKIHQNFIKQNKNDSEK